MSGRECIPTQESTIGGTANCNEFDWSLNNYNMTMLVVQVAVLLAVFIHFGMFY